MKEEELIKECLDGYKKALIEVDVSKNLIKLKNLLLETKQNKKKVFIVGNGGSAAIASHVAVDFTKQGGVSTLTFNDSDLITCFSNDYGYDYWVEKSIEFYCNKGDTLILISSSGKSKNIINAALKAKALSLSLVTFTGFSKENILLELGDISFWVDSRAYNIIENTHQIWLLMVCDLLVGKLEYSA